MFYVTFTVAMNTKEYKCWSLLYDRRTHVTKLATVANLVAKIFLFSLRRRIIMIAARSATHIRLGIYCKG